MELLLEYTKKMEPRHSNLPQEFWRGLDSGSPDVAERCGIANRRLTSSVCPCEKSHVSSSSMCLLGRVRIASGN